MELSDRSLGTERAFFAIGKEQGNRIRSGSKVFARSALPSCIPYRSHASHMGWGERRVGPTPRNGVRLECGPLLKKQRLSRFHCKDRARGFAEHGLGHATQQKPSNSAAAMGAHRDKVTRSFLRQTKNLVGCFAYSHFAFAM